MQEKSNMQLLFFSISSCQKLVQNWSMMKVFRSVCNTNCQVSASTWEAFAKTDAQTCPWCPWVFWMFHGDLFWNKATWQSAKIKRSRKEVLWIPAIFFSVFCLRLLLPAKESHGYILGRLSRNLNGSVFEDLFGRIEALKCLAKVETKATLDTLDLEVIFKNRKIRNWKVKRRPGKLPWLSEIRWHHCEDGVCCHRLRSFTAVTPWIFTSNSFPAFKLGIATNSKRRNVIEAK